MIERPILFSGSMVSAILSGEKTQTRRVVKIGPIEEDFKIVDCPYGGPGDRLWVRETFCYQTGPMSDPSNRKKSNVLYRASLDSYIAGTALTGAWRPSIHMPRWASRITLEITGIRIERLQDIRFADAMAEGIKDLSTPDHVDYGIEGVACAEHPVRAFQLLWDRINAKRGYEWDMNPLVWVISFRKLDEVPGGGLQPVQGVTGNGCADILDIE